MEQSLQLLKNGIKTAPDNPHFYYEISFQLQET